MSEPQILAQFERYGGDELRIGITSYNGGDSYLDCRIWFPPEDGGELRPTKRGITIRADEIAATIAALQRAEIELNPVVESEAA